MEFTKKNLYKRSISRYIQASENNQKKKKQSQPLSVTLLYSVDRMPVDFRTLHCVQTYIYKLFHKYEQFITVNSPTGMILGGERKPENPEETRTQTGRTCSHTGLWSFFFLSQNRSLLLISN